MTSTDRVVRATARFSSFPFRPMSPDVTPSRRALRLLARAAAVSVLAIALGNAAILGASLWARATTDTPALEVEGVAKAVVVDDKVWRGAAPTAEGYRNLAELGVTTVVDLRHDSERGEAVAVLDELDIEVVRIPIRDGQLPTDDDVRRFLEVVEEAPGRVFLHCGAGVGRTGALAAAYDVAVRDLAGPDALRRNLAVGPPSLEQIAFAATGAERPPTLVTLLSRILDAPRRIWHNL